jgi:phosphopantetheinyl transferase
LSSLREARTAAQSARRGATQATDATTPSRAVDVYYGLGADIGETARAALPRTDLERIPRIALAARRAAHLAGRMLLRSAIEDVTGRAGAEVEIRATPRGKPECAAGPNVSVSHSGPWAVCAVSASGSVGVDVQVPVPGRQIESIARAYFAPEESDWVAAHPEPRFWMLWVLKEAYLKALGVGLAGGLATLQCRIEPPLIEIVAARSPAVISVRLFLLESALATAFVGIAVVNGSCGEVSSKRWNPEPSPRWLPGRLELVAATAA